MENAGCITFREVALLLDPATAPLAVQKRVAEVITHELAHQWFGNLVTMVWWDDLWLNEAFATWMAFKIVDRWRPDWRIWMDFEGGKASALALDALQSAHPIRADVHNAEEAGESFDAITYEKGGAVLRMIEGYLGRGPLSRRHPPVHAPASRRQRHRRRSVGRARRIVRRADRRAGQRLDPPGRLPGRFGVGVNTSGGGGGGGVRCRYVWSVHPVAGAAPVLLRSRRARSRRSDPLAHPDGPALSRRRRCQGAARAARRRAGRSPDRGEGPVALVRGQRGGGGLLSLPIRRSAAGRARRRGRRAGPGGADGAGVRSVGAGPRRRRARRSVSRPRRRSEGRSGSLRARRADRPAVRH